jgi:hypothetical protein
MRTIRKFIWITAVMVLFNSYNSYSQEKCCTSVISHRIDSICKANNVKYCDPNPNLSWQMVQKKLTFKLDANFLIFDEKYYYDLSKLRYFYIDGKNVLIIVFSDK